MRCSVISLARKERTLSTLGNIHLLSLSPFHVLLGKQLFVLKSDGNLDSGILRGYCPPRFDLGLVFFRGYMILGISCCFWKGAMGFGVFVLCLYACGSFWVCGFCLREEILDI